VLYDGFEKHGWSGGNYMIDPVSQPLTRITLIRHRLDHKTYALYQDHWGLLAHRGKNGLWRVTYCDNRPDLTDEEYLAGQAEAFRRLLPGAPEPGDYSIQVTDQYRLHNRCVTSMREGRILIAADAAHICNPFGGYGCMSAVLDVGGLADCLIGLHQSLCNESILDKWAEIRREKFLRFVDRRSRKNMERLRGKDPEATIKNDDFFKMLRSMEGDDEATREFLLVSHALHYCQECSAGFGGLWLTDAILGIRQKWSSIEHDFTQYHEKQ
jgi:2-polyprenyl-6-methoxyphenol hydroxylase-like FAD-dependent oxidoreductase